MLPLKYQVARPYLEPRTRIIALSSGSEFGTLDWDDEHLVKRLDSFVGNIEQELPHKIYNDAVAIDRVSRIGDQISRPSDILLKDTHRQNRGILEKFYPDRVGLWDLRKIADFGTRQHIAISRGYERYLVESFNRLDGEWLDRKSVSL